MKNIAPGTLLNASKVDKGCYSQTCEQCPNYFDCLLDPANVIKNMKEDTLKSEFKPSRTVKYIFEV